MNRKSPLLLPFLSDTKSVNPFLHIFILCKNTNDLTLRVLRQCKPLVKLATWHEVTPHPGQLREPYLVFQQTVVKAWSRHSRTSGFASRLCDDTDVTLWRKLTGSYLHSASKMAIERGLGWKLNDRMEKEALVRRSRTLRQFLYIGWVYGFNGGM